MLDTDTIYKVCHLDGDTADWGWSPDGEGMYWFDTFQEAFEDFPHSQPKRRNFANARRFDDFRYGPLV